MGKKTASLQLILPLKLRQILVVKVNFIPGPDCCQGVDTRGDVAQQTDSILREGNQGTRHPEHVLSRCQGTQI